MTTNGKIAKNADVDAVNEIYQAARAEADIEIVKMRSEIDAIRVESQALGTIKKINYDLKHNEMLKYVVLYQVKQSKDYRKGGMTWSEFCEIIGESSRRVDEVLADLRPIVNDFSAVFADFAQMPINKIRYLGRAISAESAEIENGVLVIDDQKIPITPDNKDEIEAAIDALKESHKKQIEEQVSTIKAKDKVLKDKETLINRQAKEIAKLEGHAAEVGYTPAEEKLMQDLDNSRTIIDGYLMQYDPEKNPLPEDATPRMQAKLMHTLDYFRRVVIAAYDTAADIYGEPELDDDWVPPHLRTASESEG